MEERYEYTGSTTDFSYTMPPSEYVPPEPKFVYKVTTALGPEEKACTIINYEGRQEGDLVIPEEIDGYKVTNIAPYAFYRSEANLVVLPESVREVDARAFIECAVEEIDFSPRADVVLHTPLAVRCNKLRELYFQGKIDRLDENFTEDCPALKRVCLKWAQTVVSKQAFPENVRIWVL